MYKNIRKSFSLFLLVVVFTMIFSNCIQGMNEKDGDGSAPYQFASFFNKPPLPNLTRTTTISSGLQHEAAKNNQLMPLSKLKELVRLGRSRFSKAANPITHLIILDDLDTGMSPTELAHILFITGMPNLTNVAYVPFDSVRNDAQATNDDAYYVREQEILSKLMVDFAMTETEARNFVHIFRTLKNQQQILEIT